MQQQTTIFQTPEDKLRRRLAMTHQQRIERLFYLLKVNAMLRKMAKDIRVKNKRTQ